MKKRIFSVILAMTVVMSMLTAAGFSASAASDKIISFDVKSAGWTNIKAVYCHIYNNAYIDGLNYTGWQTKKEICDYNAETGIATFDLQKAIDEGFSGLETINGYNKWCVVFSCNTGEQTAPLVFNSRCFGDTVVAEPNTIVEGKIKSDYPTIKLEYKKNTHLTTPKHISYSGKVVGETYSYGEDDLLVFSEYVTENVFDTNKVNKDTVKKLAKELDVDARVALTSAMNYIYMDENSNYTEYEMDKAYDILDKIYDEIHAEYNILGDDFLYIVTDDGTAKILAYMGEETDVVIPSELDGHKVSSIGEMAFIATDIKSVVIPNSVTKIHTGAFTSCEELTSVVLPDSLIKLDEMAFAQCPKLESVKIPSGVKRIGDGAFMQCEALKSVEIGNGVQMIGMYAFMQCPELKSVTVPKSVVEIGEYALGYYVQSEDDEYVSVLKDFTIVGKTGTEANLYALDNNIEFISNDAEELTLGDVNGDGKVDVDDATALQKYLAEQQTLTEEQQKAADFNGENGLTVDDVTAIQKYLAGVY